MKTVGLAKWKPSRRISMSFGTAIAKSELLYPGTEDLKSMRPTGYGGIRKKL
jgi:hypothetical protein